MSDSLRKRTVAWLDIVQRLPYLAVRLPICHRTETFRAYSQRFWDEEIQKLAEEVVK